MTTKTETEPLSISLGNIKAELQGWFNKKDAADPPNDSSSDNNNNNIAIGQPIDQLNSSRLSFYNKDKVTIRVNSNKYGKDFFLSLDFTATENKNSNDDDSTKQSSRGRVLFIMVADKSGSMAGSAWKQVRTIGYSR